MGVIAILVIFQPEMRKSIEQLGRKRFISTLFSFDNGKNTVERYSERTVNEMVKACYEMGKGKDRSPDRYRERCPAWRI